MKIKSILFAISCISLTVLYVCCTKSGNSSGTSDGQSLSLASGKSGDLTLAQLQQQSLTCTFTAQGFPTSTATYDSTAMTVTTVTGNPATTQTFSNITILSGLPPYGNNGFAYVAFGDAPLFSVTISQNQEILATWDVAPGGPQNVLNAGICVETCDCKTHGDDKNGDDMDDANGSDPDAQGDANWQAHCAKFCNQ